MSAAARAGGPITAVCDLRGAQSIDHPERGIARWVSHHAVAVARRPEVGEVLGLVHPGRPLPPLVAAGGGIEPVTPAGLATRLARVGGPVVHHVGSPFELYIPITEMVPAALRAPRTVRSATLYDVIPLVYGEHDAAWVRRLWVVRAELLRTADTVLAISRHSAADAVQRLGIDPRRMHVVGTGVPPAPPLPPAADPAALGVPGLDRPFVMYSGGTEHRRKNVEALIRAFGLLAPATRDAHRLLVVGRMTDEVRGRLLQVAGDHGVAGHLVLAGFVSDELLDRLYASCACVVYPSLYEGFGLPIAEAMSHGAPVAGSRATSCAELVVDERAAFDPQDDRDIARATALLLEDASLAAEVARRGRALAAELTWDRVAERSVAAWGRALARRAGRPRPARPAGPAATTLVCPVAPDGPGPALAFHRLAAALAEHRRTRLVTPERVGSLVAGLTVVPGGALPEVFAAAGGPTVCLVEGPVAAGRAAAILRGLGPVRGRVAVVWELEPLLDDEAPGVPARPELVDLVAAADLVVAAGEAARTRLLHALGAHPHPPVVVLPPPLAPDLGPGLSGAPAGAAAPAARDLAVVPLPPRLGGVPARVADLAAGAGALLAGQGGPAMRLLAGTHPAPGVLPWPGLLTLGGVLARLRAVVDPWPAGSSAALQAADLAMMAGVPLVRPPARADAAGLADLVLAAGGADPWDPADLAARSAERVAERLDAELGQAA